MLSLLNIGSNPKSHQYYVEYSQECGEPQGVFYGRGAEELGLKWQAVTSEQMEKLLQGFSPSGETLCRNAGRNHRGGWDATFSAPKSVSIVWSSADNSLRTEIEKAHAKAVRSAIGYYEDNSSFVRVGKGGHSRKHAKIITALFEHGSSRAGEPQLHTHAIIFNVAKSYDKKGDWRTLESRDFYISQMAASSFYKAEFAFELRKLGFNIERTTDSFEIVGVPQNVCDAQSTRSKQIKAQLENAGFDVDSASARAKELSALRTRSEKDRLGRDFETWKVQNAANGFDQKLIDQIRSQSDAVLSAKPDANSTSQIVEKLTESHSTFAFYQLDRHIAENLIGKADTKTIREVLKETKTDGPALQVGTGRYNEKRFSTQSMVELEKEIIKILERRTPEKHHILKSELVKKELKQNQSLNREQREAVQLLTRAPGGVQFVEGQAGTGKSYMLGVVKSLYEKGDFELVGLSFTNKAARNLEESSGIKSKSVDSFLYSQKNKVTLNEKSVVVVDEAAMLDSRKTLALSKLCEETKAKIIFVGDAKQIQPITAGQAFETQRKRFVSSRLVDVFRQKLDWERAAVSELRNGNVVAALTQFEEKKQLKILRTPKAVRAEIVKDWFAHTKKNPNDEAVIVCSKNAEVNQLNQLAREKLKESKAIGSGIALETKHGSFEFSVGDKLIFTANAKKQGIYNSTLGTVTKISTKQVSVKTENGTEVNFDPRQFQNFRHGYAITAHKSQGSTVDRAFVYVDGFSMDREKFYVAVSRGRKNNTIYADRTSFHELSYEERQKLTRLPRKEIYKTLKSHWRKEVAAIVGISHQKDTTQDYSKVSYRTPFLSRLVEKLRSFDFRNNQTKEIKQEISKLKESVARVQDTSQRQTTTQDKSQRR